MKPVGGYSYHCYSGYDMTFEPVRVLFFAREVQRERDFGRLDKIKSDAPTVRLRKAGIRYSNGSTTVVSMNAIVLTKHIRQRAAGQTWDGPCLKFADEKNDTKDFCVVVEETNLYGMSAEDYLETLLRKVDP